jgi:hypothetical protein
MLGLGRRQWPRCIVQEPWKSIAACQVALPLSEYPNCSGPNSSKSLQKESMQPWSITLLPDGRRSDHRQVGPLSIRKMTKESQISFRPVSDALVYKRTIIKNAPSQDEVSSSGCNANLAQKRVNEKKVYLEGVQAYLVGALGASLSTSPHLETPQCGDWIIWRRLPGVEQQGCSSRNLLKLGAG